jgi:hypothetical protein
LIRNLTACWRDAAIRARSENLSTVKLHESALRAQRLSLDTTGLRMAIWV